MKRAMIAAVALATALAAIPAVIAYAAQAKLTVQESDQFGNYLADDDGRALYIYTADTQGQAGSPATSNCYGTCADAWPPMTADQSATERTGVVDLQRDRTSRAGAQESQGSPREGLSQTQPTGREEMPETESLFQDRDRTGAKVQDAMIATTERRDGAQQVTYNGWPLYYYEKDTESGQTSGHGVKDAKGEWYLIAPDGNKIEKHEESTERTERTRRPSIN